MYSKKKICCVILARKGSKGIKNKNLLKLNKIPLFLHPIIEAKKSKYIDKIFFNSDCKKMIKLAKQNGATSDFIRNKRLSSDNALSAEVLIDHINFYNLSEKFDYMILLEPTSPLTSSKDIDKAIKILINFKSGTSLLTVVKNTIPNPEFSFQISGKFLKPIQDRSIYNLPRQNFTSRYYLCGALYISKISSYINFQSFIQKKTTFYKIAKFKSFEIDDLEDYKIIQKLYTLKK
jgi:N-acylneuraminate cytidylyltransferase/CMP-N,N'-diacetyllegionaminic acid synthase